ncbi:cold-shock protein [Paenibacillus konkukensis]
MEPIQEEQTPVWMCSNEGCSCWMRENFALEETPACPLCQSEMVKNTKMLPALVNYHKSY